MIWKQIQKMPGDSGIREEIYDLKKIIVSGRFKGEEFNLILDGLIHFLNAHEIADLPLLELLQLSLTRQREQNESKR